MQDHVQINNIHRFQFLVYSGLTQARPELQVHVWLMCHSTSHTKLLFTLAEEHHLIDEIDKPELRDNHRSAVQDKPMSPIQRSDGVVTSLNNVVQSNSDSMFKKPKQQSNCVASHKSVLGYHHASQQRFSR